jgi:hypothetical protein
MKRIGAVMGVSAALMAGAAATAWAEPAPPCVRVSEASVASGYTKYTITNGCPSGQDVKIIISFNPDIGCTYYAPNQSRSYTYSWPSKVDRLESC